MSPDLPQEFVQDAKRWQEKEAALKKEFQSSFREFYKVKKEAFNKTQAAIRFNKTVVNNSMVGLQVQLIRGEFYLILSFIVKLFPNLFSVSLF
jgi:hypothetical protein